MRDTLFVEFFIAGGWTQREAQCVERWIEDKRPGGKATMHFLIAITKHFSDTMARKDFDINALLERIDHLENSLQLFELPQKAGR